MCIGCKIDTILSIYNYRKILVIAIFLYAFLDHDKNLTFHEGENYIFRRTFGIFKRHKYLKDLKICNKILLTE